MQIGHRWTGMYLIEKHMCHTLKIIIFASPCVFCSHPFSVILRSFFRSYVWLRCWHLATPFVKLFKWGHHVSFVYCLEWWQKRGWSVHECHFSLSLSRYNPSRLLSPSLSFSVNPVVALEERPGHYEKPLMSVWCGVLWCTAYYSHSSELGDTWQADSQQVV